MPRESIIFEINIGYLGIGFFVAALFDLCIYFMVCEMIGKIKEKGQK
jgi:hypothetical protein